MEPGLSTENNSKQDKSVKGELLWVKYLDQPKASVGQQYPPKSTVKIEIVVITSINCFYSIELLISPNNSTTILRVINIYPLTLRIYREVIILSKSYLKLEYHPLRKTMSFNLIII